MQQTSERERPSGRPFGRFRGLVVGHVGNELRCDLRGAVASTGHSGIEAAVVDRTTGNGRRRQAGPSRMLLDFLDDLFSVHEHKVDFCPARVNGLLSASDLAGYIGKCQYA